MAALPSAIEPSLELANADGVLGLGLLDADGQARRRAGRRVIRIGVEPRVYYGARIYSKLDDIIGPHHLTAGRHRIAGLFETLYRIITRANSTAKIAAAIASGQKLSLGELSTGHLTDCLQIVVARHHQEPLVRLDGALQFAHRSSEKFIHGIKVLMAKNYIDNLSEETRKGMLEKAAQGIFPSYAPIGYKNADGPNGKKIIVLDETRAPLSSQMTG
jgi:hypothetical protein